MCPDQHSFQTMTSYLEDDALADESSLAHVSHPNPRLSTQSLHTYSGPFIQHAYPPTHSMHRSHERTLQSSQQHIHHHDDRPDGGMEFEYTSYPRSQPTDQGRASHHSTDQYQASLQPTSGSTRPKLDTHLSLESLPAHDYQHTRPDAAMLSYREALTDYHNAQATILEGPSRVDRDHTLSRGRQESPLSYSKDSDDGSTPYQEGIRIFTSSSSIPMSNYPSSPLSTGHGPARFAFESHPNVNLRTTELDDVHSIPDDSSRHNRRHPDNGQVDAVINNVIPSLTPYQSDRHPRSRATTDTQSHNYHFTRDASPSSSSYCQQEPQPQNLPTHARPRHPHHARSSLSYSETLDARIIVNDDHQLGDTYDYNMDLDSNSQPSSTPLSQTGQAEGQVARATSNNTLTRHSENMILSGTPSSTSDPSQEQLPLKKKKKSKMHECEICQKKFPRPSGLKTHMNTHSNERPYPCGFPGCERTFGVRSNAKRHLRTHGVAPTPMPTPSHPQYVVGFETPVVLPDQRPDGRHYGQGAGVSHSKALDGEHHDEMGAADEGDEDRGHHEDDFAGHSVGGRPSLRTPTYKVRWMPPSVTSRTNMEESYLYAPDQDRRTDDPYRLNLRHEYEHTPGHGENSYKHNRPPHEHAHRYPHSRHDLKGKQRWREDGAYPSFSGIEYPSQTRAPPDDPDTTSSDNNMSGHATRIKSSSRFARVCACSPPCPVDSSGEVSCQLLVAQPEYAASVLGSRLSDSTSPDQPPSGFYNAQTTSSTTRTSQPPYSGALRKVKEEENVIQTELEGRSYHQAVSHPYAKRPVKTSPKP